MHPDDAHVARTKYTRTEGKTITKCEIKQQHKRLCRQIGMRFKCFFLLKINVSASTKSFQCRKPILTSHQSHFALFFLLYLHFYSHTFFYLLLRHIFSYFCSCFCCYSWSYSCSYKSCQNQQKNIDSFKTLFCTMSSHFIQ